MGVLFCLFFHQKTSISGRALNETHAHNIGIHNGKHELAAVSAASLAFWISVVREENLCSTTVQDGG